MGILVQSTMSSDLVWQCVRKNSSFIHTRRNGTNKAQFTAEPNNLTNLNRFKDSGLANSQAVGLVPNKEKGCVMSIKNPKRMRQVGRSGPKTKFAGSFTKVATAITKSTKGSFYRSDLTNTALARWYKIWKSQPQYHPS